MAKIQIQDVLVSLMYTVMCFAQIFDTLSFCEAQTIEPNLVIVIEGEIVEVVCSPRFDAALPLLTIASPGDDAFRHVTEDNVETEDDGMVSRTFFVSGLTRNDNASQFKCIVASVPSDPALILVYYPPNITVEINTPVAVGNDAAVTFTVEAYPDPTPAEPTVTRMDGGPIPAFAVTDSTVIFSDVIQNHTGTYILTLSNAAGLGNTTFELIVVSASITDVEIVNPSLSPERDTLFFCPTDTLIFTCEAILPPGAPTWAISWNIVGEFASELNFVSTGIPPTVGSQETDANTGAVAELTVVESTQWVSTLTLINPGVALSDPLTVSVLCSDPIETTSRNLSALTAIPTFLGNVSQNRARDSINKTTVINWQPATISQGGVTYIIDTGNDGITAPDSTTMTHTQVTVDSFNTPYNICVEATNECGQPSGTPSCTTVIIEAEGFSIGTIIGLATGSVTGAMVIIAVICCCCCCCCCVSIRGGWRVTSGKSTSDVEMKGQEVPEYEEVSESPQPTGQEIFTEQNQAYGHVLELPQLSCCEIITEQNQAYELQSSGCEIITEQNQAYEHVSQLTQPTCCEIDTEQNQAYNMVT